MHYNTIKRQQLLKYHRIKLGKLSCQLCDQALAETKAQMHHIFATSNMSVTNQEFYPLELLTVLCESCHIGNASGVVDSPPLRRKLIDLNKQVFGDIRVNAAIDVLKDLLYVDIYNLMRKE